MTDLTSTRTVSLAADPSGANATTSCIRSNLSPQTAKIYSEVNETRAGITPRVPQPDNPNISSWVANADGTTTVSITSSNPTLNGKTVVYDAEGFPVYHPYLKPDGVNSVKIRMTGSRSVDVASANELAGYGRTANDTPIGYTWHHNQDLGLMQLANEDIHALTPHSGGVAIWEREFGVKYEQVRKK